MSDWFSAEEYVRVFENVNTGEQFLLTIWPDGQAEIATRPTRWARWGPPMPLVLEEAS